MDESKVKEIIAQNNQDLLSMINYLVSTSISDLKRSSDSNAAEQMSEIKRLKRDDPLNFFFTSLLYIFQQTLIGLFIISFSPLS